MLDHLLAHTKFGCHRKRISFIILHRKNFVNWSQKLSSEGSTRSLSIGVQQSVDRCCFGFWETDRITNRASKREAMGRIKFFSVTVVPDMNVNTVGSLAPQCADTVYLWRKIEAFSSPKKSGDLGERCKSPRLIKIQLATHRSSTAIACCPSAFVMAKRRGGCDGVDYRTQVGQPVLEPAMTIHSFDPFKQPRPIDISGTCGKFHKPLLIEQAFGFLNEQCRLFVDLVGIKTKATCRLAKFETI